jgi:hypothetical protein
VIPWTIEYLKGEENTFALYCGKFFHFSIHRQMQERCDSHILQDSPTIILSILLHWFLRLLLHFSSRSLKLCLLRWLTLSLFLIHLQSQFVVQLIQWTCRHPNMMKPYDHRCGTPILQLSQMDCSHHGQNDSRSRQN